MRIPHLFVHLLYVILLTSGVGYFTQQNAISYTGIGLMVLSLGTVTTQYRNLFKKISQSAAGTYKYRGILGGMQQATPPRPCSVCRVQGGFCIGRPIFPSASNGCT